MAGQVGQIILDLILNNRQFNDEMNDTQRQVERILRDTESDVRSRAARIANIYHQQGMSRSAAMRRAWNETRRLASDSCDAIAGSSESATGRISNAFSGIGKKIAAAFSVAAVTAFTKECIEASAGVNALNSQFEQTFGSMSKGAEQAMQSVAKESGIVESRLQGVGTSIYAFAKTTGMDSANALTMMQEALQVTADSAAYYDRSLEETAESLKSFLKGNFENDAALGLSCTETTRNTAANKLYGKSFIELSESQKQLTLLQMVKDANQLSGAMGQASREADGWENVTGNLKETWKQFLAVVGQPVLQVATQVVKQLSSALQTLTGYAKQATDAMAQFFGWDTSATANAISAASDSANSLADSIEDTEKAAKKLQNRLSGFDELNVLSSTSSDDNEDNSITTPITQLTPVTMDTTPAEQTASGLIKIFENLKNALQPAKVALDRLNESLEPLKKFACKALEDFYNNFLKPLGKWVLGEGLPRFIDAITKMLKNIAWDKLNKALKDFWKALEPFAENIGEGLLWLWENVLTPLAGWTISDVIPAFLDILSGALNVLNAVIEKLKSPIKWLWDNFLKPIVDWTGGVIVSALNGIADALNWIAGNDTAITILSSLAIAIGTYNAVMGIAAMATKGVAAAQTILNAVMAANPIGIIIAIIAGLIAAVILLWNNCDWFREFWINAWNSITEWAGNAWESISGFFIDAWNKICNVFSGIGTWFSDIFSGAADSIKNAWNGVTGFFSGIWTGIKNTFSKVTNWFSDVFSKAWQAVKDVFSKGGEVFNGIKDGILNALKAVINGLINGINTVISIPFKGINTALEGIKGIEIAGWKPFEWISTIETPQIPKLAKGGLVKAPTLALVGDNAGAGTGDPEVVAPLSKLQGMINSSSNEADTQLLQQILTYLIKLYELFSSHYSNGSDIYEIVLELDGDPVFKKILQLNNIYKKRHGGKSAFV